MLSVYTASLLFAISNMSNLPMNLIDHYSKVACICMHNAYELDSGWLICVYCLIVY